MWITHRAHDMSSLVSPAGKKSDKSRRKEKSKKRKAPTAAAGLAAAGVAAAPKKLKRTGNFSPQKEDARYDTEMRIQEIVKQRLNDWTVRMYARNTYLIRISDKIMRREKERIENEVRRQVVPVRKQHAPARVQTTTDPCILL